MFRAVKYRLRFGRTTGGGGKRTVEVPVEFNFTSSGNELTTRTNPVGPGNPGETNTRPIYVDRVKVYIYQRPADQTYETDREGFLRANELVLPAHRTGNAGADGQPRFTATGKFPWRVSMNTE
ncbi:hypothetical protein [Parabacteroides distasonis]|uniref:hypothetical protein n=1 Tax=Parabacteroides distasonis TaxID=823 RepID=UPI0021C83BAD|nr:hypothetical protein [Parabacteroides distasonis]